MVDWEQFQLPKQQMCPKKNALPLAIEGPSHNARECHTLHLQGCQANGRVSTVACLRAPKIKRHAAISSDNQLWSEKTAQVRNALRFVRGVARPPATPSGDAPNEPPRPFRRARESEIGRAAPAAARGGTRPATPQGVRPRVRRAVAAMRRPLRTVPGSRSTARRTRRGRNLHLAPVGARSN